MKKEKFMAYVRLERPQYSIIMFLTACGGMMAAYQGVPRVIDLIGVGFLFWFILNTAHPVNDYFDREVDKLARPEAPLPKGDLTPEEAKKSIILHYILVPLLIILIVPLLSVKTYPLMIVAFFGLLLGFIYSAPPIRTRKRGIFKDITVGLAPSTTFLGGWVAVRAWNIDTEFFVLVSVYFFLLVCSQMLADIHDMKGEITAEWKTLPVQIGVKKTFYFSLVIGILATVSVSIPIFLSWFNEYYTIIGTVLILWILSIYIRAFLNFDPEKGRVWNENLLMGVFIYSIAIIVGSL